MTQKKTPHKAASKKSSAKPQKAAKVTEGAKTTEIGDKTVFGKKDRGLGRGLSALMADVNLLAPEPEIVPNANGENKPADKAAGSVQQGYNETGGLADSGHVNPAQTERQKISRGISVIAIDQLVRNPDQPRKYFDAAALSELTSSIKDKGVLQPILVRPVPDRSRVETKGASKTKSLYQIVAGERRWQASLKAGLSSIPALVRELSDQEVLEIGVIENVQRADLNPMEEAQAYRALINQFGRTQQDVSNAIGKSRPHIANMLRLLTLPMRAQDALKTGEISTGHARAIVAAPDPDALVEHIIEKRLSVRDAEDWVRRLKKQAAKADSNVLSPAAPPSRSEKSPDIRAVEAELRDALGLVVDLRHSGPSGELRLKYRTDDQLAELLTRLKRS